MQEKSERMSKTIKVLKQVFKVIKKIFRIIGKILSVLWKIIGIVMGKQFTGAVENTVGDIRRGNGFR